MSKAFHMEKSSLSDRHQVTALSRGLDILRCFNLPGVELSVSALARMAGLSQPTTWRLCQTLLNSGFLVRAPAGAGLRIGAPVLTLGYAAIQGMGLPEIALPYMNEITQQTKASTTLSARHDIEMISVQRINGEFVIPNEPIGWRSLLTSVPSGLAVLAALSEPNRTQALRQIEAREPSAWSRRAMRVENAITEYQKYGWVIHDSMMDGRYAAIAVPLLATAPENPQAWALSCGGLASFLDTTTLRRNGELLLRIKSLLQPAVM